MSLKRFARDQNALLVWDVFRGEMTQKGQGAAC